MSSIKALKEQLEKFELSIKEGIEGISLRLQKVETREPVLDDDPVKEEIIKKNRKYWHSDHNCQRKGCQRTKGGSSEN